MYLAENALKCVGGRG